MLDGTVNASYANFGYIPYGHSIIGHLYFDNRNAFGCNEYSETKFEKDADGDITPFMIARRGGGCSFVKKIRNMENIGIAVGIIVDDTNEDIENVIMSDDGTGGGIRIPSMIVSRLEGNKLIDYVIRASKEELSQLAIMADFVMEKPDNRVEYDIWFTSSNDRALDFISDFMYSDFQFGEQVLMTPHYVFWKCTFCEQDYLDKDCFSGGRYCAVDSSNEKHRGRDIILEDLR